MSEQTRKMMLDRFRDAMDIVGTLAKSDKIGFLGKPPIPKVQPLTPPTPAQVTDVKIGGASVLPGGVKTIIDNNTARINEIEARLRAYGLLP